jgi:hypothetical protein
MVGLSGARFLWYVDDLSIEAGIISRAVHQMHHFLQVVRDSKTLYTDYVVYNKVF